MQMSNSPYHWARSDRDRRALATAWLLALGAVYLSTYWLSNQLTHRRADVGTTVFAWERAIPFVEWTIVPYLSIVLFFVASFFTGQREHDYRDQLQRHVVRLLLVLIVSLACFALMPLRFTFERPSTSGFTGWLFQALHMFDLPYNRAPSLHISVLVLLWARLSSCLLPRPLDWRRVVLALWFLLIAVSVLTTYQHHVVDVLGGLLAGCGSLRAADPAMRCAKRLLQRLAGRVTLPQR
jgi:hypothetical protein